MKTTVTSVQKLLVFFILCFALLFSAQLNSQIRLVEVKPSENKATIKNFGSSMENISTYWFCSLFAYNQLSSLTVDSGSLDLEAGATVTISVTLRESDADLGLYSTNSFGSASAMVDFMQWGDAGNGREGVANTAEIWSAGDFLAGSGPFVYNGNGTQNGSNFWVNGTLGINDPFLNAALSIYPNPTSSTLNIKKLQNINLNEAVIYDHTGRLISAINLSQIIAIKAIALDHISNGIYFIRITDDQGRRLAKQFIKK